MNKAENGKSEYFLGLDIGTGSVGWAVTDETYNLQKANRKYLWGVRLFDTANTAADRRLNRAARRRHQRKLQRLRLLQEIFDKEVSKVDPDFFARLKESAYHTDDRSGSFISTLFNDESFKDADYHSQYPTIFHLRSYLLHHPEEKPDIRILYLAFHSILKNRGHFLFNKASIESTDSLADILEELKENVYRTLGCELSINTPIHDVEKILKKKRKTEKKKELHNVLTLVRESESEIEEEPKKVLTELIKALSGSVFQLSALFEDPELKESDVDKVDFGQETYEINKDAMEQLLEPEAFTVIENLEGIYNWTLLSDILNGHDFLSDAKIASYKQHKADLQALKTLVKKYSPSDYYKVFKAPDEKDNYAHYIGTGNVAGKKVQISTKLKNRCSQEDVNKYFKKVLSPFADEQDLELAAMLENLELNSCLPKQRTRENRVIPHQLHQKELEVILTNASTYYPFLTIQDDDGYTPVDKISKMMTFRIPYYVGPLNTSHMVKGGNDGFCWMVRQEGKSGLPILPWNWETIVDQNASAEKFINRMTNKCTYLYNEDVIPKFSLRYKRYMLLNELNNLKVNGQSITVELKKHIYNELFLRSGKKTVTLKMLKTFLITNNVISRGDEATIEGIDNGFANSLGSLIDFTPYLDSGILNTEQVEQIIEWKAFYVDDEKILTVKIENEYGSFLDSNQIADIVKMIKSYKGWGRLSRKFLEEIYHEDKATGEVRSILTMMWETNENLMRLLSSEYDFIDEVQKINNEYFIEKRFSYEDIVKPLSVSPSVKRQIWQTLLVVRELKKVKGYAPSKIFIEMAREKGEKKRTTSRKQSLQYLYQACKNDVSFNNALLESLETRTDADLRNDRLYFYYTQMGRCLYSGEPIDLANLDNPQYYDIDHIYPQSVIKDDSLHNRALVKSQYNGQKGNTYPIDPSWQQKMGSFWNVLVERGLISKEKYKRLTRTHALNDEELFSFISRQLTETRQGTKIVASIIDNLFKSEGTKIVYVKAGNVSRFRTDFDIKKSRLVNDHHHAHDAYLNIVVGNSYHTKYTDDPRKYISEVRRGEQHFNISKMFEKSIERYGKVAWIPDANLAFNGGKNKFERENETGTIKTIRKTMRNHQVLVTRQAVKQSGGLFNLQPLRKKVNLIPLKDSGSVFRNTMRYGGYSSATTAYFMLVKHVVKNKDVKTLYPVSIMNAQQFESDDAAQEYCRNILSLHNPTILIKKILLHDLISINGYIMSLSGVTGPRIVAKNEIQLMLDEKWYDYFSMMEKLTSLLAKVPDNEKQANALRLMESMGLSQKKNLELYDILNAKERDSLYKYRPANQTQFLEAVRPRFSELDGSEQCEVLLQMVNLFTCTPINANLKKIGGGGSVGIVKFQSTVSNKGSILLHRSPTGIFEQKRSIDDL